MLTETQVVAVERDRKLRLSSVSSSASLKISITRETAEFIAFAMYRLWNPRKISRRHTHSKSKSTSSEEVIINFTSGDWYEGYVDKMYSLIKGSGMPTPFIFMALLYIARLREFIPASTDSQTGQTEFKLFFSALIVSQKQNSDSRYANKTWAKIAGVDVGLVNTLEREFLMAMRWNLHIKDFQYQKWTMALQNLGKEHALVLRAVKMEDSEFSRLAFQLKSRPDLVEEIRSIRRVNTL